MMRWAVWSAYLLLLSAALLTPHPAHLAHDLFPADDARFAAAKSLHLGTFAFLAVLTGWLRPPPPRRWLLLLVLSLYACGTEFLQQFVPSRSGTWQDVTINHTGLYLGVLLSWRWWLSERRA